VWLDNRWTDDVCSLRNGVTGRDLDCYIGLTNFNGSYNINGSLADVAVESSTLDIKYELLNSTINNLYICMKQFDDFYDFYEFVL